MSELPGLLVCNNTQATNCNSSIYTQECQFDMVQICSYIHDAAPPTTTITTTKRTKGVKAREQFMIVVNRQHRSPFAMNPPLGFIQWIYLQLLSLCQKSYSLQILNGHVWQWMTRSMATNCHRKQPISDWSKKCHCCVPTQARHGNRQHKEMFQLTTAWSAQCC